jgi:hypothetical protein
MVYITHDIDWLNPQHLYSVIKTITHGKRWIGIAQLTNSYLFIDGIKQLLNYNSKHKVNAIWLVGASTKNTFYRKGLRYNTREKWWHEIIEVLLKAEVEIGLHSVSNQSIKVQADSLIKAINKPIKYHRSHFLKYDANTLYPQLINAGIQTDLSLGNARSVNLIVPQEKFGIPIMPTVLFDNAFFFEPPQYVLEKFEQVLFDANEIGQDVAVLFHPENFVINPTLWRYYEEVLALVKKYNC